MEQQPLSVTGFFTKLGNIILDTIQTAFKDKPVAALGYIGLLLVIVLQYMNNQDNKIEFARQRVAWEAKEQAYQRIDSAKNERLLDEKEKRRRESEDREQEREEAQKYMRDEQYYQRTNPRR